jgi:hypothetical protein
MTYLFICATEVTLSVYLLYSIVNVGMCGFAMCGAHVYVYKFLVWSVQYRVRYSASRLNVLFPCFTYLALYISWKFQLDN